MVTWIIAVVVLGWSVLFAVVGPLLLRPVSTCAGPEHRCSGVVDLGAALASWGPIVVAVAMLAAVARRASRGRATTPAALLGAAAVVAVQVLGQSLVPFGVVPR